MDSSMVKTFQPCHLWCSFDMYERIVHHLLTGLGEKEGGLIFERTEERPVLTGRDMRWTINLDRAVNQDGRSH